MSLEGLETVEKETELSPQDVVVLLSSTGKSWEVSHEDPKTVEQERQFGPEDVTCSRPSAGKRSREESWEVSHEDPKTVEQETQFGPEDVTCLRPAAGKRSREESLVVGLESSDEDDLIVYEAAESDDDIQHEKVAQSTSKEAKKPADENVVGQLVSEKTPTHASKSVATQNKSFHCTVCSVYSTSEKDYRVHVCGKRHARALMGTVLCQSGKIGKLGAGSKANLSMQSEPADLHEGMPMEQQVQINGLITDEGGSTSCMGATDLQGAHLLALGISLMDDSKDVIMEQQNTRKKACMAALGAKDPRDESMTKSIVYDGRESFKENLTNGYMSTDGVANSTVTDLGGCKHDSDCVAQAFHGCACLGVSGLSKVGTGNQPEVPQQSVVGGAVISTIPGVVAMHPHCLMNFIHEVQVKAIDNLLERLTHEKKARVFTSEIWLPSTAVSSMILHGEKDTSCSLCNVEYTSKSHLDLHVAGKKHSFMVKRQHLRCHLCNVQSNSEKDLEVHMKGKKHASKLQLVQKGVAI